MRRMQLCDKTAPLDNGDMACLADISVWIDREYDSPPAGCLAILDAECELVCYCPAEKAEMMVRLINSYPIALPDIEETA